MVIWAGRACLYAGVLVLMAGCSTTAAGPVPSVVPVATIATSTAPARDAPTMQACREYENELTASGLAKFGDELMTGTGVTDIDAFSAAEHSYVPVEGRAAIPQVANVISAFNGVIVIDMQYGPTLSADKIFVTGVRDDCKAAGYTFS